MKRPRYSKAEEIELLPDAWDRFKRGVHIVAKAKPKHRTSKTRKPKKRA
jgi:hypothetical protein